MRKRTRSILQHLALLLTCSMVILNFGSMISRSIVRAYDNALQDSATITLVNIYTRDSNNEPVSLRGDNPPTVAYNADYIYVDLKWTFPDGPGVVVPGQTFTYQLPERISFNSASDTLVNGNKAVGSFVVNEHSITITYFDDANGTEFCSGTNRWSELTFSGQVIGDVTDSNLPASITADFPGVAESVTINMERPNAQQTSLEVNKDNRTLVDDATHRYQYIAYVISHGVNNNVVVSDWPSAGQDIDTSTFGIYTDAACTNAYTGNYTLAYLTNTGFRFTLDSMADGETIYIRYQVTIRPALYDPNGDRSFIGDSYGPAGYHGNVSNTLEAVSDTAPAAIDYHDIGTYDVKINKYHAGNIVDEGLIGWDIYVYKITENFSNIYVIDTLPTNTTFVTDGFYVVGGGVYTDLVQVEILPNNQVKFDLSNPTITDYLKNTDGANVRIRYYVRVTQQASAHGVYQNNAKLYLDNGPMIDEATADAAFDMPPVIEKTGRYDTATAPNAIFTITVNPLALNVDTTDSHDTLTLVDTFPETYDLQVSSVAITRDDGGALTTETYTYDETTKVLTLTLRDQTAYTITYRATVNRRVGTQLDQSNSTNSISIDGVLPAIADGYYFQCLVVRSAGSASSYNPDIATLNVIKHESGDTTSLLQGAQFSLAPVTIGTGNTVTLGTAVTQTTGAGGVASFEVDREKVYMLTEVSAPDGYTRDENNYFYAFANDVSSLPATVTYGGQTYTVTIISSDRASRDVYFANDRAAATIVDPTTPTEPATTTVPAATAPSQTTPTAAAAAATVTPTEPSSEPSDTTTVQDTTTPTEPAVTEIDPNAVNGAGRGLAGEQPADAATTAAAVTSVASTGEINSSARILGVVYIFVAFQLLALLRYERKHGILPTGNNEQG